MDKRVQHEVSRAFVKRFLFHIVIYVFFVVVIGETGWFYCNSKIWYRDDMLYPVIHFLHENFAAVFLFMVCSGWVLIGCIHFLWIVSMLTV